MKITEYNKTSAVEKANVLLIDGVGGTKIIEAANLAIELAGMISPQMHRNIFRGKNLGNAFTASQKAAVLNGSFDDLFVGDYWNINGSNWRIADMDYWINCGDTSFTKHHLVIVPDSQLFSAKMNETNITEGGYVGSEMYKTSLSQAKTKVTEAFGDAVLSHREYLVNAVSNGKPSGGSWYDSTVELMNEIMVYGCSFFTPSNDGLTIPNKYTIGNSQLALFQMCPAHIKNRQSYWLRDVVSAALFARVNYSGSADCYAASDSVGVRPVFAIG